MTKHRNLFLLILLFFGVLFYLPSSTTASSDECTINSFDSTYQLQSGSFDVKTNITVDCGNLPDKHGIYLTLQKRVAKPIAHDTPIKLTEITNEKNEAYKYEESSDDQTITWKIGDPEKTITGVNTYIIRYTVDRVINSAGNDQNEIYWDILGNYWKMPIMSFSARIIPPAEVTELNTAVALYDGAEGSSANTLSNFHKTSE